MLSLDTNVVSELIRPEPDLLVLSNIRTLPSNDLHIAAVTEAEILLGVAILPDGKKKAALQRA